MPHMYLGPPAARRDYRNPYGHRRLRRSPQVPRTMLCAAPWDSSSAQPKGSWILESDDESTQDKDDLENIRDRKAPPVKTDMQLEVDEAFGLASQAMTDLKFTEAPCLDPKKKHHYDPGLLPLMTFNDLDKILFRSVLKGNVYLVIARLPRGVDARTCRPGLHGRPRISIELSHTIFRYGKLYVLGVLLHQMIHAYYLQCCGYRSRGVDSNGHDLRHGPEFAALLQTIRKHFLPGENDLWRGERLSLLQPRMASRSPIHEAGSSDCYCLSQAPAKPVVAERWRMAALALTLSREAVRKTEESAAQRCYLPLNNILQPVQSPFQQLSYPNNSFELRYQGKSYCIPKSGDPHFEALSKSHFFENGGYNVPSTVRQDEFQLLHQFLFNKDHAPDLEYTLKDMVGQLTATSHLASCLDGGPPYILSFGYSSPPYLLNSIMSYNLAMYLQFEPLARLAMQRLESLPFTLENPIPILEHIYQQTSLPHPTLEIRSWVRRWLSLRLDPFPPNWDMYTTSHPTNLSVLEKSPALAARFTALQQNSDDLLADISYVLNCSPAVQGKRQIDAEKPAYVDSAWWSTAAQHPELWKDVRFDQQALLQDRLRQQEMIDDLREQLANTHLRS